MTNIQRGAHLVKTHNETFGKVAEFSDKWASWWPTSPRPPKSRPKASNQINRAMSDMDRVTQPGGLGSRRKPHRPAEQLKAQSNQVSNFVQDLEHPGGRRQQRVAGGSGKTKKSAKQKASQQPPAQAAQNRLAYQPGAKAAAKAGQTDTSVDDEDFF